MPASIAPADQIQQRKKKYPDDIDEVPVQPAHFKRRVIFGIETPAICHHRQRRQYAQPDDHVQGMQASHKKIKAEKQLNALRVRSAIRKMQAGNQPLRPIARPLERELDPEECRPKQHRQNSDT